MRSTTITIREYEYQLELDPSVTSYFSLVQEAREKYNTHQAIQGIRDTLPGLIHKSEIPDWRCQHTQLAEAAFFGSGIPSICPAGIKNSIHGSLATSEHGVGSPIALQYCHLLAAFSYAALRDRDRNYPLPDGVRAEYDHLIVEQLKHLIIRDHSTWQGVHPIIDQTEVAAIAPIPGYA